MSTKLTRLVATSFAAIALATAGSALATPANAGTSSTSFAAASTWIKYGDYSSDAKCKAKGKQLRANGTYLSYYCEYTGFFTLMVLTR
ncbi:MULTISPECIES: hypothetical protein [unclassified Streptosporangium]|uniref:hypothetical protein n=1 Tax=unclassified Streptosporangium TaxID=2632669 RepID=UPI002E2BB8D2|nr:MULTISPECIES: hypothetical protein [unclassified Streptosporangium]